MAEFKIVVADTKTGKCYQKEAKDDVAESLMGKQIGDVIAGEVLEMTGYEFQITGGSDDAGFPMRRDLQGVQRRKLLLTEGLGFHNKRNGIRRRKSVAGNTVHEKTAQINVKVTKYGKTPLEAPAEDASEPKAE